MIIFRNGVPDPEGADARAELIGLAFERAQDELAAARIALAAVTEAFELAQERCTRIGGKVNRAAENCAETRLAAAVVLTADGYRPAERV
jgi:hypothetical protein